MRSMAGKESKFPQIGILGGSLHAKSENRVNFYAYGHLGVWAAASHQLLLRVRVEVETYTPVP